MSTMQSYTERNFFAKRFALWLGIGSMVMMFAGLTSAYIVKKGDVSNWITFTIPAYFYASTLVILVSSVFMYLAQRAFKKEELTKYKNLLWLTFATGIAFLLMQVLGWYHLIQKGYLLSDPDQASAAFFYVISGTHAVHVLGGLVILLISLTGISNKLKDPLYDLTMAISPKRKFRVELVSTYWHFVDVLWLYLFFFLMYNHL